MGITSIEWTDRSVNPIRARLGAAAGHHCEKVSPGCTNCYASRMQRRFQMPPFQADKRGGLEPVAPFFDESRLQEVLRRKTPTKWFWCDMSDLFGSWVPDAWIDRCFAVMALTPQHTHQVLTKRPDRMVAYFTNGNRRAVVAAHAAAIAGDNAPEMVVRFWPLLNVWLGTSVEDQQRAGERIPLLLQTPAAVRFISAEPLLGPLNLLSPLVCRCQGSDPYIHKHYSEPPHSCARCGHTSCARLTRLDWVIVGGESGPGARKCDVAWVRSIVRQCKAAGVPAFVKQLGAHVRDRNDAGFDATSHTFADGPEIGRPVNPGAWPDAIGEQDLVEHNPDGFRDEYQGAPVRIHLCDRKGGDPSEWPEDLRVRAFPEN